MSCIFPPLIRFLSKIDKLQLAKNRERARENECAFKMYIDAAKRAESESNDGGGGDDDVESIKRTSVL